MKHLMIDYENIHNANVHNIQQDTQIWIFIGAKQPTPSLEQTNHLFQRFGAENVHLMQVHWNAPNALDFCLSYHLGKIIQSDPDALVWILSRDQGFQVLVNQIRMEEKADKVFTANNVRDLIEKMNAHSSAATPIQIIVNEPTDTQNQTVQITFQATENTSSQPENTQEIPAAQMQTRYTALCYQLLRQAANANALTFTRREILETNLAKHIQNTTWEENPVMVCSQEALESYIHRAISRYIDREHIMVNPETGTLMYFLTDEDMYQRAKRMYFNTNPDCLPKIKYTALNQLKNLANGFSLETPLEKWAETWFQRLQDENMIFVANDCISYESLHDAREAALKLRLVKLLNQELGTKLKPQNMTALKETIAKRAAEELVEFNDNDIYQYVGSLINKQRIFMNGEVIMWANVPTSPTKPLATKPVAPKSNATFKSQSPWQHIMHIIKTHNRPNSLDKLKVHLIHSLTKYNLTESDIDRFIQRLQDEGYVQVNYETGHLIYS